MSVLRIKAYHGSGSPISNSINYVINEDKTDMSRHQEWFDNSDVHLSFVSGMKLDANAENAFEYAVNPEKTTYEGDMGTAQELVSGYLCDPDMAALQFQATMDLYYQNHDEHLTTHNARRIFRAKLDEGGKPVTDKDGNMVYDEKAPVWHDADGKCRYETYKKEMQARTAYMWVLSFPPEEVCGFKIDPRICHQIGLEFCKQIGDGQFQSVISTHMDKAHPHDHIVMCAYSRDGSHKYLDNLASLTSARQICDDLSRNFGLPVLPTFSQEQGKPVSWAEWKSKQDGQSWKEQMKKDIRGAVRVARSYDQFLDIMKSSGYGIRETENHLTYIMPGEEEYRCRDKRLGSEFEKTALIEHFNEKQKNKELERDITREAITRIIEDPTNVKSHKPIHIFVPRYSFSGRRRSDLEMVFLAAIMIIRELKDRFHDATAAKAQPINPVHRDWAWKERQMMDSIKMCQNLNIQTKQELDDMIKDTGTRLSVVKKEIRDLELDKGFSEKVLSLIGDIECYRKLLSGTGFDERYLFLNERDEKQIRLNRAGENPATPSQRRELYIQLQRYNNVYKLTCKYNELDSREASKVIEFLQGKSDNKPGVLVGGSDWENREYQEDYDHFTEMGSEAETEEHNDQASEAQTKNDMLFEQHLLDYNLQIQMAIMRLRYAAQQLMDLGIRPEDYDNEKKIARGDLDRLQNSLRDVDTLKREYRNLQRLKYNYGLASSDPFTHGGLFGRQGEKLDIEEHNKGSRLSEDKKQQDEYIGRQENNRNSASDLSLFGLIDEYFDQTHGI